MSHDQYFAQTTNYCVEKGISLSLKVTIPIRILTQGVSLDNLDENSENRRPHRAGIEEVREIRYWSGPGLKRLLYVGLEESSK